MDKLTKEDVLRRIQDIHNNGGDDETQHCIEADIRQSFIESVSEGHYTVDESMEIAMLILTTKDISFSRLFA